MSAKLLTLVQICWLLYWFEEFKISSLSGSIWFNSDRIGNLNVNPGILRSNIDNYIVDKLGTAAVEGSRVTVQDFFQTGPDWH